MSCLELLPLLPLLPLLLLPPLLLLQLLLSWRRWCCGCGWGQWAGSHKGDGESTTNHMICCRPWLQHRLPAQPLSTTTSTSTTMTTALAETATAVAAMAVAATAAIWMAAAWAARDVLRLEPMVCFFYLNYFLNNVFLGHTPKRPWQQQQHQWQGLETQ